MAVAGEEEAAVVTVVAAAGGTEAAEATVTAAGGEAMTDTAVVEEAGVAGVAGADIMIVRVAVGGRASAHRRGGGKVTTGGATRLTAATGTDLGALAVVDMSLIHATLLIHGRLCLNAIPGMLGFRFGITAYTANEPMLQRLFLFL